MLEMQKRGISNGNVTLRHYPCQPQMSFFKRINLDF